MLSGLADAVSGQMNAKIRGDAHHDPAPGTDIPLTALLSWVWIAHVIEVDNAFEAISAQRVGHRFRISLPMWSNGLRLIPDEGVTVDELRFLARADCNLGGLERWGWITVGDVSSKRRDGYGTRRGIKGGTILRPTRAGAYARQAWPRIVSRVEEKWSARFGADVIDALRRALTEVAVPMPWSPPEVHPSDGFRTHVVDSDAASAEAPIVSLLGRVLTAFTLEDEQSAEVSLPLGANVLRLIDSEVVRIRDLPALSGVSKEAIAMATGYLQRNAFASSEPDRRIALTPDGLDALDGYRSRALRSDQDDLRAALEAVVSQGNSLREGLAPPDGCWRGQSPYLAQTKRLLADPTKALPWHPMVLHRGGWPDGN
jgi:hypothetical protein